MILSVILGDYCTKRWILNRLPNNQQKDSSVMGYFVRAADAFFILLMKLLFAAFTFFLSCCLLLFIELNIDRGKYYVNIMVDPIV